jgi:hypothetical protein
LQRRAAKKCRRVIKRRVVRRKHNSRRGGRRVVRKQRKVGKFLVYCVFFLFDVRFLKDFEAQTAEEKASPRPSEQETRHQTSSSQQAQARQGFVVAFVAKELF